MEEHNTVLLTGAAGSLGSALARQCAQEGYSLVLLDRDRRALERLFDQMVEEGLEEPALHPLDLASAGPEDFRAMLDAIEMQFGSLTALIHCAARFEGLTPLEHIAPEEWLLSMQVNVNAPWLLSAMCLPVLRRATSACLYFMLEDLPTVGGALWGAYGVGKHALRALVGQFAATCEASSVQVLGIHPGAMQSPLRAKAYFEEDPTRPTHPEQVARHIVDLLQRRFLPAGTFVDLSFS